MKSISGVLLMTLAVGTWWGASGAQRSEDPVAAFWRETAAHRQVPWHTSVDRLLWEAHGWRQLASRAVNAERDALAAWDPGAVPTLWHNSWRLAALARDRHGYLLHARALLVQAAANARSLRDAGRVAQLRALVEHEAGDHREEWRQARALSNSGVRPQVAGTLLHRAMVCNAPIDDTCRRMLYLDDYTSQHPKE